MFAYARVVLSPEEDSMLKRFKLGLALGWILAGPFAIITVRAQEEPLVIRTETAVPLRGCGGAFLNPCLEAETLVTSDTFIARDGYGTDVFTIPDGGTFIAADGSVMSIIPSIYTGPLYTIDNRANEVQVDPDFADVDSGASSTTSLKEAK